MSIYLVVPRTVEVPLSTLQELSLKHNYNNINGRDVQRKKCCKQCGQIKFMGTMTKWPVQKHT